KEFEAGRLPAERLLDFLERQGGVLKKPPAGGGGLPQRPAQNGPEAHRATTPPPAPRAPPPPAPTRAAAEPRRRARPGRATPPGRRPTELKCSQAHTFEDLYADGVPPSDCQLLRARVVWRLRDGHAVLVGYRLFGRRGGPEPSIPGVTPRCEYGLEILVVLAF